MKVNEEGCDIEHRASHAPVPPLEKLLDTLIILHNLGILKEVDDEVVEATIVEAVIGVVPFGSISQSEDNLDCINK